MRQTHVQLGTKNNFIWIIKTPAAITSSVRHRHISVALRSLSHSTQSPALTAPCVSAGEAAPGVPGRAVPAVPTCPGDPAVPADTDGLSLRAVPGPGQRRVPGTPREEEQGPLGAGEPSAFCSSCGFCSFVLERKLRQWALLLLLMSLFIASAVSRGLDSQHHTL